VLLRFLQIAPFPWGIWSPSNTWYLRPTQVIISNNISIGSAVFVWVPNAMVYIALSVGKETPKTAPSFCDFVTLPEEDRATAIGNMHRKIGKDRACGSGDIFAVRQTDRQTHTQTCSSQYFAPAPTGEVTIQKKWNRNTMCQQDTKAVESCTNMCRRACRPYTTEILSERQEMYRYRVSL